MADKLSILSQLLNNLSRLPGLSFLSKAGQEVDQVRSAKQNLDAAKQSAKDLAGKPQSPQP